MGSELEPHSAPGRRAWGQRPAERGAIVLFAAALSLLLFWRQFGAPSTIAHDGIVVDARHAHLRFTMVMVFGGSRPAPYLSIMFQSVAANARDYDLLFVNVDAGDGCLDLVHLSDRASPTYAPNIRPICLSEAENDALAAEWLCSGWGGCSPDDRQTVDFHLGRIHREREGTEIFNTFKHWRGLVYRRNITTPWWAFADADQIFGRTAGQLPFDIMANFDAVFTTAHILTTPALFTPGQLMLFRYSNKMDRIPFAYPPFASPAALKDMLPGDHAHHLAEFVYSDFFLHNATEVDLLRVTGPMSMEPVNFNRRLVLVGGRVLSVDRNLPRHELQYWLNALAHDPADVPSFGPGGFTVPETLNLTRDVPCSGDVWNPSGCCPTNRPTGALRTYLYRKDGRWYTRYDQRTVVAAPDEMAPLEEKLFAHLQQIKHAANLTLPDFVESGYLADRTSADAGDGDGSQAVFELTDQWWGRWRIRRGDFMPRSGFDIVRTFGDALPEPSDEYYAIHHRHLA